MTNEEKKYTDSIAELERKITQLQNDIKANDDTDTKYRRVVLTIIICCGIAHFIGSIINPFIALSALIILLVDVITGWAVLSKFENKDAKLKEELEETELQLEDKKEEYENFLEVEYREYSRPRINPTIVTTPINNNNNNKREYTNINHK